MSDWVVDASVAIKWFFPEIHAEAALRMLEGRHALRAPDLIIAEFGNVLWKRFLKEEISGKEAVTVTDAFLALPLQVESSRALIPVAMQIACSARRTVYDGLYVAMAVVHQCQLITADSKLYNALRNGPLSAYLRWVEDIPA
jgi:predicted nucleic acid-binding protein